MREGEATSDLSGERSSKPGSEISRRKLVKRLAVDAAVGVVIVVPVLVWVLSPMVWVMESGSMQHSRTDAQAGVLDSGDGMLVVRVPEESLVSTYVQGRSSGYSSLGEFGDVIVYLKFGKTGSTPVTHRAVVRVVWNPATASWDIPELAGLKEGTDWTRSAGGPGPSDFRGGASNHVLTIQSYGYAGRKVTVEFGWLREGTTGFITLGDNSVTNIRIDQARGTGVSDGEPVRWEWILGVVGTEIPCLGVVKLGQSHLSRAPSSQVPCAAGILIGLLLLPFFVHAAISFAIVRWRKRHPKPAGEGHSPPMDPGPAETHK